MSWQPPPEDSTEILSRAIEWRESGFTGGNARLGQSPGRVGIMGVPEQEWAKYAKPGADPNNPDDNREVGRMYVRDLLKQYKTPAMALSAYLTGDPSVPQRVDPRSTQVADYVENTLHYFNIMRGTAKGTVPIEALAQFPDIGKLNPKAVPSPMDMAIDKLNTPTWTKPREQTAPMASVYIKPDNFDTKLTPEDEKSYEAWVAGEKAKGREMSTEDYDLRGWWQAHKGESAPSGHFEDTFKKPNHPTFSNESQYSGKDGYEGGQWIENKDKTWTFKASPTNIRQRGVGALEEYFSKYEKGNTLQLPEDPGVMDRMWEAAKEGFGSERLGPSQETMDLLEKFGPLVSQTGRSLGTAADLVSRGINALVYAGSEATASIAEGLGASQTSADQLRRDLPTMANLGLIIAGTTPRAMGSPDMPRMLTEMPVPKGLAVHDDVRSQLIDAGRPIAEAEANAEIWRAHTAVLARALGKTPEEIYGRLALDVKKVEPAAPPKGGKFMKFGTTEKDIPDPGLRAAVADAGRAIDSMDQPRATIWRKNGQYKSTMGSAPGPDWAYAADVVNHEGRPVIYTYRGATRYENNMNRVYIGAGADASTFVHESAHVFLGNLERLKGESTLLDSDFAAIVGWAMEGSRGKEPLMPGSMLSRGGHERFARGFEKYVAEGKAPTPQLTHAFDQFAGWMLKVYGNLDKLHVKLSPTVRKLMGDLLDEHSARLPAEGIVAAGSPAPQPPEQPGQKPRVSIRADVGANLEPGTVRPDGSLVLPTPKPINPPVNKTGNIRMPAGEKIDPEYAMNIALHRINEGEDVKDVIKDTADMYRKSFDEARRGTISHALSKEMADLLNLTEDKFLKTMKGTAFNAEEMAAARDVVIRSARRTADQAAKAAQTGAEQDYAEFARLALRHRMLQEKLHGGIAEAGRTLSILNSGAGKGVAEANRALIDALGGDRRLHQMAEHTLLLGQNSKAVAKYLKHASDPNWADKLYWLYINSLLWGLKTHVANLGGNTLSMAFDIVETAVAEQLPGKAGLVRGEAAAKAAALFRSQLEAQQAFWHTILRGADAEYALKASEAVQPEPFKMFRGLSGSVFPTRWLSAEDAYFRTLAYRQQLAALSLREAKRSGLKGVARRQLRRDLMNNPTEAMVEVASKFADYQTFVKDLGPWGRTFTKLVRDTPGGRFISPFIRTPANLMKYAGERTPLAVLSPSVRASLLGRNGQAAQQMAIARFMLGSGLVVWTATMVLDGNITGSGPRDPAANRVWRRKYQPNSMRIGDTWVSYSRIEPLATIFGTTADMIQGWQDSQAADKSMEDAAFAFLANMTLNMTDKTFLTGPVRGLRALLDPQAYGKNWIYSMAASVVPRSITSIAEMQDPYVRAARGLRENLMRRVPGLRQQLPFNYDVFGDKIKYNAIGPSWASPLSTQKVRPDLLVDEMLRLRVFPTVPTHQIIFENNVIELTTAESMEIQQIRGKLIQLAGTNLVHNSQWALMTYEQQQHMLRELYKTAGKVARMRVLSEILKGGGIDRAKRKKR